MSKRITLKSAWLVAIIAALGLSIGQTANARLETKTAQRLPESRGEEAVNRLKQAGLYDSLAEAVRATHYRIKAQAGGYQAVNPAQDYVTNFTADGIQVYDSLGRELDGRMSLAGGSVRLEVDDEAAVYPVTVDPLLTQQAKLTAGDAASGDEFGNSVAISGNTAVVGALHNDDAGGDSGSAYVFAPPPPPGDPYADAVGPGTILVLHPNKAVGAPDGHVATVFSLLGIPSLVLDMGAGEEGTGNLKVHYKGLAVELLTTVDFLDADGHKISAGQLHLVDLSAGTHVAEAPYAGAPTPYRFVRLRGVLLLSFGVNAVEADSIVSP